MTAGWRLPYVLGALLLLSVRSLLAAQPEILAQGESLNDAWNAALCVDARLEATRWYASAARNQLKAVQAERLPTVTTVGSYLVRDHEPAFEFDFNGLPVGSGRFPYQQDAGFLSLTTMRLPLYTSGRIEQGIAAAQSKCGAAGSDVARWTQNLKLNTAVAYTAVLRAQRGCQVAESLARSLAAHHQQVAEQYKNQFLSQSDALAAEVAWASADQDLRHARNDLDIAVRRIQSADGTCAECACTATGARRVENVSRFNCPDRTGT